LLTVEYNEHIGIVVADAAVPHIVQYWLGLHQQGQLTTIAAGNEMLIDQFRLAVLDEQISHEDIMFMYQGEQIKVDTYGKLAHWPTGMCDLQQTQLRRLILGADKKRDKLKLKASE
jgi:hypothetical protein